MNSKNQTSDSRHQTPNQRSGTKEWAAVNKNIQIGCEHNCRYCYARAMAVRYGRCTKEQWPEPVIDQVKVDKIYGKAKNDGSYEYDCMFPSTHDITPRNLFQSLILITKLLTAGNKVLIVSKPHWSCITAICGELKPFMDQVNFRFTIGSTYNKTLEFWEPGAPNFIERISCLQYAHKCGYKTSVSCEPMLDPYVANLYEACSDFVTESFWVGKMRKFKQRVDLSGISEDDYKKFIEPLLVTLDDNFIKLIYETMKEYPLIRWKDSIRAVVESSK